MPPELQAPVAPVVLLQIDGDPHQPGHRARIAAKVFPVPVRLQETFLRQRLRQIHVPQRCQQETEDLRPVAFDDARKFRAAISSAASAVIGSTAVPAAIDLVDVTMRRKFTTPASIFAPRRHKAQTQRGRKRAASPLFLSTVQRRSPLACSAASRTWPRFARKVLSLLKGIIRCGGVSSFAVNDVASRPQPDR